VCFQLNLWDGLAKTAGTEINRFLKARVSSAKWILSWQVFVV